jgi:isoquinoline 1-oxidoreductase subunit beta
MKRRTWLLGGLGAAGALIVGWGVMPMRSRLGKPEHMLPATAGEVALNGWIKIAQDGSVVLAMARAEMGQGVHTSLPMLVAEELDVPLSMVRLEQAGPDSIYGNVMMMRVAVPFHPLEMEGPELPAKIKATHWLVDKAVRELGLNATGGSSSVSDAWDHLRMAAALARANLVGAAAKQWQVPVAEVAVVNGVVQHASGKKGHYGEFAKGAAGMNLTEAKLKDRKDWKLIGTPAPRPDIPAKTNGTALFGIDARPQGLVYATVRQSPMLGGSLGSLDEKAAMAIKGVERIVHLPGYAGSSAGFAVVGKTTWHALQGAAAVEAVWKQRPLGALNSAAIQAHLTQMADAEDGFSFHKKGDAAAALGRATRVIAATYSAPFLAHATMEPMNCTAQVKDGQVTLWTGTQVPEVARAIAAQVAGVALDKVKLHALLLGGGFGRRLEVDYVAQAVRVAMDCGGRPVQLVWSREEDTTHDVYRPMQVAHLKASVDVPGQFSALSIKSAGDALTPRFMERILPAMAGPIDPPDKSSAEGLFDLPYGFAHQHMAHVATRTHVPIGNWRSVGHSQNAFIAESFIDEIAFETQQDPMALRRALLKEAPRYLAVLNLAAEKANWGSALPSGLVGSQRRCRAARVVRLHRRAGG